QQPIFAQFDWRTRWCTEPMARKQYCEGRIVAEAEKENSRFGLIIASSLILTLLLTIIMPMVFSSNKDTAYSAYVDDDMAQVNLMADTLGDDGWGYSIANTMSTPMLVNDWKDPHRTMLVIVAPEKPIDETEASKIHEFVTEKGGKVIIAADNTNANRVAAKFGVTFQSAPLYDQDQFWQEENPETDKMRPDNWKNVWSLSSINQSVDGMSSTELKFACEEADLKAYEYDGCRLPVMFRSPTGLMVENYSEDNADNRQIKVLAKASRGACIDYAGDGDCGNEMNPAPGNLSLVVRIDYPGIETMDYKTGSSSSRSDIDVTGSILFVSDEEAFSNRLWDLDVAKSTGMSQDCYDQMSTSCWQMDMPEVQWTGNDVFFTALIFSMMEFDNQELSSTIKLSRSNFYIVFDESRHVTGIMSAPFTDAMATIVLLTSDAFLKWLIILNVLLLLLVAIMVVPEKANWRHVFDLTRFRERPEKIDPNSYRQRVREALMAKVRIFHDLTRDEMAMKAPAEVQTMIGDPRLTELAYSQNRTYSPEELRALLQTIRRWGKKS
ncbi:MAG: hypothetical protein VX320_03580, partial [Candidatus Thermoplasmatota archaeon]|nr:hypothetical protein [Candidatus Thermoplasmatota archaeon]